MLVEIAIGDSYGVGYEYVSDVVIRKTNQVIAYRQHPKHIEIKPGSYSDDTQMALGLAQFLLSEDSPTTLNLVSYFARAFQRDPRTGYSGGFYKILKECCPPQRDPKDAAIALMGMLTPHSVKSGGAMRASPCGLLKTPQEALDKAMWQASVTHATKDGMSAAGAAALLAWGCRHGVEDLPRFLASYLPEYFWGDIWKTKVGSAGIDAVKAALTAIESYDNLRDILWKCIDYTGDVDTVAAIAMGAASLHPGIENNLPDPLYAKLENGKYGLDFLRDLDRRLLAAYPL
jgi:ADP-ribosylglycohydrolase